MNTSRKRRNFNKALLNIDCNELNRLKDEKTSFIKLVKCNHHLALHPYHLSNVKKSLKEKLNQEICRYDKKLGGIILGFQNMKILDDCAPINSDMCFIHMDVEVEFFVFMPAVEQVHRGIVNKQTNKQIGCLVHKIFNVFLPKPNDEDEWLGSNAHVGQEIQFRITYIDLEGRLPYIRGELLSILSEDSGISTSEELGTTPKRNKKATYMALKEETVKVTKKRKLEDSLEESEEPKKKKHKSKKNSIHENMPEQINIKKEFIVEEHNTTESTVKKHKRLKKPKEELIEVEQAEHSTKKKKLKKVKKEKVDLDTSMDLDLSEFFKEDCTNSSNTDYMAMADAPDKGKRRMSNSTSADIQWSSKEFKLPPDSDMEEILKNTEKSKKKRRASVCAEFAAAASEDDFVAPSKNIKRRSKEFKLPPDSAKEDILKNSEKYNKKGLKRRAEIATAASKDEFVAPSKNIKRRSKESKLPPDTAKEGILKNSGKSNKKGIKRRASVCAEFAAAASEDDFVTPFEKVKRKLK